jgi:hypothetical protein
MGIEPGLFLPYMNVALDGMLRCVEQLGDQRVNLKPDLEGANSPYVLLHHCVQLSHWWVGAMCADRDMIRDRDSEFVATGTVADLREAVVDLKTRLAEDVPGMDAAAPMCRPDLLPEGARARGWTKGECLVHAYEELAQHHGHMEITRDVLMAG